MLHEIKQQLIDLFMIIKFHSVMKLVFVFYISGGSQCLCTRLAYLLIKAVNQSGCMLTPTGMLG